MSTTDLFVELIVIGTGAAFWFFLLLVSSLGEDWLPFFETLPASIMLILVLAVIYFLGILTDRLADALFDPLWGSKLVEKEFGCAREYYHARSIILTKSEPFSELLDYGRSRMRICRGWTVNLCLLLIVYNYWLWKTVNNFDKLFMALCGSGILISFIIWTWFTWRMLVTKEYAKIEEQAEFLKERD